MQSMLKMMASRFMVPSVGEIVQVDGDCERHFNFPARSALSRKPA
jgi:hypothetical protein